MIAPRFSTRERGLGILVLMAIAIWGSVSWMGVPLWERLASLQQEAQTAQQKTARLQALVQRRSQIEQQYARDARFVAEEPDDVLHRRFLDELEALAKEGDLQLNLKPRPVQRERSLSRLGVELDVEAPQDGLLAFLDRLLTAPSLIELERLSLSATPAKDHSLKATLLVHKIVVRQ